MDSGVCCEVIKNMKKQSLSDTQLQRIRNILVSVFAACLIIGGPVFLLQFSEYRLIGRYQAEGTVRQASVTDLSAEHYRWRTEYDIAVQYVNAAGVQTQGNITQVVHGNTYNQLSIRDTVDILVIDSADADSAKPLLQKATTMEYWRPYYIRMIISGAALVVGALLFVYLFATRKEAVARVARLEGKR